MRPYLSIDIETTGLSVEKCDVIEFAAVVDDYVSPLEQLPCFHCYILQDNYQGEPFALSMHQTIFQRISRKEPGYTYLRPNKLGVELAGFINLHKIRKTFASTEPIIVAGKNFSSFDKPFLEKIPEFNNYIKFHHRSIDPAMFFWEPTEDDAPPSLKICMERAGLSGNVPHTALEDATIVVKLVRRIVEIKSNMKKETYGKVLS